MGLHMTANQLDFSAGPGNAAIDDYEEGTWNMNVYYEQNSNVQHTMQNGYYTKISDWVMLAYWYQYNKLGGNFNWNMAGNPFPMSTPMAEQ